MVQSTDDVLQSGTPETSVMLLTDVNPINI